MKLLVILLMIFSGVTKADDLEDYSRQLVSALQEKDVSSYLKTFPDRRELNKFIHKKLTGDTTEIPEMVNEATYQQILNEQKEKFSEIIAAGESMGLNWEKATYLSHDIYHLEDEEQNVKMYKGSIIVWDGNDKFKLNVRDIYQFASGYAGEVKSIEKIIPVPDEIKN